MLEGDFMIFKRKAYDKLLQWKKECDGSRAVLLEGARRVGKSTIAEEFARNEYRSYLLIDFSKVNDTIKSYFYDYLEDLDTLFMFLMSAYNVKLYRRESVVIFDEVQLFPRARECIKHLVKDGRYDYIETGSLISIRENVQDILIPSEERSFKMYPLDFEEFCLAMNADILLGYIKQCFGERVPLEEGRHKQAMLLFKQYLLVGGMPQSVSAFIKSDKDFSNADTEKRDILKLYREDIMKIKSPYKSKVLSIFDQIPGLLSRHEKRVVFKNVEKGSYSEQYEDTFFWLEDSMICNVCFNCQDPNVGLSMNEDRTYVKCYMGDTGLLLSHAFDENGLIEEQLYSQILNDKLSVNEGMLYENAIAQMLVASGHKLYFYTHYSEEKHRNDIEIDFITSNNSKLKFKIFPIEVKSSKRYATASLERFVEKYKDRIGEAFIIHPKNLSVKDKITSIPPYMTFCL